MLVVITLCLVMMIPARAFASAETPLITVSQPSDTPLSPYPSQSAVTHEGSRESEIVSTAGYEKLTVIQLNEKVKECRQTLLETRLEVVRKANEAKQRLEELIKGDKPGALSAEILRKDLDTIKEAQRVLATVLSDIVNVTTATPGAAASAPAGSGGTVPAYNATGAASTGSAGTNVAADQTGYTNEAGEATGPAAQPGSGAASGATSTATTPAGTQVQTPEQDAFREGLPATVAAQQQTPLSREYLESLIVLYNAKIQQLVRIADSLDRIVMIG